MDVPDHRWKHSLALFAQHVCVMHVKTMYGPLHHVLELLVASKLAEHAIAFVFYALGNFLSKFHCVVLHDTSVFHLFKVDVLMFVYSMRLPFFTRLEGHFANLAITFPLLSFFFPHKTCTCVITLVCLEDFQVFRIALKAVFLLSQLFVSLLGDPLLFEFVFLEPMLGCFPVFLKCFLSEKGHVAVFALEFAASLICYLKIFCCFKRSLFSSYSLAF